MIANSKKPSFLPKILKILNTKNLVLYQNNILEVIYPQDLLAIQKVI